MRTFHRSWLILITATLILNPALVQIVEGIQDAAKPAPDDTRVGGSPLPSEMESETQTSPVYAPPTQFADFRTNTNTTSDSNLHRASLSHRPPIMRYWGPDSSIIPTAIIGGFSAVDAQLQHRGPPTILL